MPSRPVRELPAVGAERTLEVRAGRWKLVLLWHLLDAPLRLRDLERAVPGASQKVLRHRCAIAAWWRSTRQSAIRSFAATLAHVAARRTLRSPALEQQ